MVRAKFKVHDIQDHSTKGTVQTRYVCMHPVSSDADDPHSENHSFWSATPSGELRMAITNPAAYGQFVVNGEYYLDFTPVEVADAAKEA